MVSRHNSTVDQAPGSQQDPYLLLFTGDGGCIRHNSSPFELLANLFVTGSFG